jgi:hypothetical protein
MGKSVRVVRGISAWAGQTGEVITEDGQEVVVRLQGKDDVGTSTFDVRMPAGNVEPLPAEPS